MSRTGTGQGLMGMGAVIENIWLTQHARVKVYKNKSPQQG